MFGSFKFEGMIGNDFLEINKSVHVYFITSKVRMCNQGVTKKQFIGIANNTFYYFCNGFDIPCGN